MDRGESDCRCWSIRLAGNKRPVPQPRSPLWATMRPSAVICGTESRGALDSTDVTITCTSTQSLHEGIAGASSEGTLSPCEAGAEQHAQNDDRTSMWPSEPTQTTEAPSWAALLRTSNAANVKTVTVMECRDFIFIDRQCVTERRTRSYSPRVQHPQRGSVSRTSSPDGCLVDTSTMGTGISVA